MGTDKRIERGAAKRDAILRHAVDIASLEGLDSLTIGRIAGDLGISKSGAILHFGSKQDLQLAAIEAAAQRFVDHVVTPADTAASGLPRLHALIGHWIDTIDTDLYPGGCFFTTVTTEYHSRPGPVRTAIADTHVAWTAVLQHHADAAVTAGHLAPGTDTRQLVYQIDATTRHLIVVRQLHDDPAAILRARTAAHTVLHAAATDAGRALLPSPSADRITQIDTHDDPTGPTVISLRGAETAAPPTDDHHQEQRR